MHNVIVCLNLWIELNFKIWYSHWLFCCIAMVGPSFRSRIKHIILFYHIFEDIPPFRMSEPAVLFSQRRWNVQMGFNFNFNFFNGINERVCVCLVEETTITMNGRSRNLRGFLETVIFWRLKSKMTMEAHSFI